MILNIFANYVKDVNFYVNVHLVKDDVNNYVTGAIREIKMTKDPNILQGLVNKELHFIGTFDDETGILAAAEAPRVLIRYNDFLPKVEGEKVVEKEGI